MYWKHISYYFSFSVITNVFHSQLNENPILWKNVYYFFQSNILIFTENSWKFGLVFGKHKINHTEYPSRELLVYAWSDLNG